MSRPAFQMYIIFLILIAIWNLGIISAPILAHYNYSCAANAVYSFYSRICHQEDARSLQIAGEKLGVCIRCTSIYSGAFMALLLMPIFGALKTGLSAKKFVFFAALMPMIIDVVLNDLNLHSSSTITRIITGALFGAVALWWLMPLVIEAGLQIIDKRRNRSLNPGEH